MNKVVVLKKMCYDLGLNHRPENSIINFVSAVIVSNHYANTAISFTRIKTMYKKSISV